MNKNDFTLFYSLYHSKYTNQYIVLNTTRTHDTLKALETVGNLKTQAINTQRFC